MRFVTVGSDLEAAALAAVGYFRDRGYSVKAEPYEFDYPRSPTIRCTKGKARLFVEVMAEYSPTVVDAWIAYSKTRDNETAVVILVRTPPGLPMDVVTALRAKRVGIFSFGENGIVEVTAPSDLAVNIAIPSLDGLKSCYKSKLRICFDKMVGGEWLDGFRDACQVLEESARELLRDGMKRGRVAFVKRGKRTNYVASRIGRMTLGQLAHAYAEVQNPTQVDVAMRRALEMINGARIKVVHQTSKARNNAGVRVRVSQHLWTIVSALRQVK